ncbi:MAG: hypothetical protein AAFQ80_05460 [Cyanobacteria bacterium J06621_8]
MKYLSPYKDDPYGKLKGDKSESFIGVTFSEAIVHKTDGAYIIAGHVTEYRGVTRSYKPEEALEPGLCAVPIYGKEYEVRKKGSDGNWTSDKFQPSRFEKALYEEIAANEDDWMPHNSAIKVKITFPNDISLENDSDDEVKAQIAKWVQNEQIDLSGKLPEYKAPVPYSKNKGGNGYRGISPDEKIAFLKKQIQADIKDPAYDKEESLAELTNQMLREHADSPNFIEIYFDMLISCVR